MKTMTILLGKRQKQGVWRRTTATGFVECSVCRVWLPDDAKKICISRYYYCPRCGAKMTYGGENNEYYGGGRAFKE